MDKARRTQLKLLKFKKRLKLYGIKITDLGNHNAFRTTGKPCSCFMCSPIKFSRKKKHKNSEV